MSALGTELQSTLESVAGTGKLLVALQRCNTTAAII